MREGLRRLLLDVAYLTYLSDFGVDDSARGGLIFGGLLATDLVGS
jgi:hypothetical protein